MIRIRWMLRLLMLRRRMSGVWVSHVDAIGRVIVLVVDIDTGNL